MTGAEKKAARLQREAAAWNAAHPVGTPVRYWRRPALRGEDQPTGEGVVLSPAVAKHDHVSVAVAEGVALGGASRRVVPTHRTRPPTIHQDETVEEAGHGGPASSTVYRTGARRPRQVTTGGAA